MFFRQQDGPAAYCQAIKQLDTDTFKPLCNFLKGGTNNTDTKNVELLAWLIDLGPRPYAIWRNSVKSANVNEIGFEKEGPEPRTHHVIENPVDSPSKPDKVKAVDRFTDFNRYKISLLTLLAAVTCLSAYLVNSHVAGNGIIGKTEECMYWDQDHYQPIRCSKKMSGVTVYALDTAKAARLRKITSPDTLTKMAVGSVWYSKIDGNVEFFTSGGFHPIVTTRRLKPVTEFIIGKYAGQPQ